VRQRELQALVTHRATGAQPAGSEQRFATLREELVDVTATARRVVTPRHDATFGFDQSRFSAAARSRQVRVQ